MKKFLTLLLTVLLTLSLFGCSKQEQSGEDEPIHIKLEMSTLFVVPALEATKNVENQLNDYLRNTLHENFVVDLVITSINDYFTTVPMELAGGEGAPDVIQIFGMASNVDQGYIIELDPYLDKELKPTLDLIGNIAGAGKMAGHTYMIPRFFGTVLDWKWLYNKEMVEAAGVDLSGITDIESLEPVLAELKKAYPDEHFIVYTDQFPNLYQFATHTSPVGSYACTVGTDTKLQSYYESESYQKAIRTAYEYRQKGYCDPEGSNNTMSHDLVVFSGSSKGVIMGHSADVASISEMFTSNNTYGATFDGKTIAISDLTTDSLGIGISYTCKHPAEAARFINMLYCDEFVWCTLIYGAEGQDYVWNEDHTLTDYPEGLDFNTIPYNCIYSCGMIGNGFQGLPREGNNSGSSGGGSYAQELMQNAWCPPLYGFTPTTTNVQTEAAALQNVVEQYNNSLIYGDVDPDVVYPQFIKALKDAGIDKVVADFQTQVDEWLANR